MSETLEFFQDVVARMAAGQDSREVSDEQAKRFKTLEEYCLKEADKLPQRQAFYTMDLADVLYKVQHWKEKFPNVEIFYAVKANTDPVLLKLLVLQGLSFDCATMGEIELMLSIGATPEKIIFANTIKTTEELLYAEEKGVDLMTFDNEEELLKIHELYRRARLLLRVSPSSISCIFDLSLKFGCSEEEAEELLHLAQKMEMNVVGISFHVGSLCTDPESYTSTINSCRRLFDIAKMMNFKFTVLDVGGGFFGQIGTEHIFDQMAEAIQDAVDENFPTNETRIIGEPGCYLVSSAVRLVCTVIGKKVLKDKKSGSISRNYFINDGIYGSFSYGIELYGPNLKQLPTDSENNRRMLECRLFGQTCCSGDVIRKKTLLPDMKLGDRVVFDNIGAYSRNIYSTFCGVPSPLARYVFEYNSRLDMDKIANKEEVERFVKKYVTLIGYEEDGVFG